MYARFFNPLYSCIWPNKTDQLEKISLTGRTEQRFDDLYPLSQNVTEANKQIIEQRKLEKQLEQIKGIQILQLTNNLRVQYQIYEQKRNELSRLAKSNPNYAQLAEEVRIAEGGYHKADEKLKNVMTDNRGTVVAANPEPMRLKL